MCIYFPYNQWWKTHKTQRFSPFAVPHEKPMTVTYLWGFRPEHNSALADPFAWLTPKLRRWNAMVKL